MRIVISSAPKAGNKWLKCLLGSVYELEWLLGERTGPIRAAEFGDWVAGGGFPDDSIMHLHRRFSDRLVDAIEATPARAVTIVRDPYDLFVSYYFWAQEKAAHDPPKPRQRPREALVGKPLEHPDVLAFLATEFGTVLAIAAGWLGSGRAIVVRYEDLHADPSGALTRVTDRIAPVEPAQIGQALDACSVEKMRQMSPELARHVRKGIVGDWYNHLTEAHLAIFRAQHSETIRSLGYAVH
jgi:hypothetical protein